MNSIFSTGSRRAYPCAISYTSCRTFVSPAKVLERTALGDRQPSPLVLKNLGSIRFGSTQPLLQPRLQPSQVHVAAPRTPFIQPDPALLLAPDEAELESLPDDIDDRVSPVSLAPSYDDLSDEQKQILHKVREGESIFFTGSAGTGKSVLLRAIIKDLGGPSSSVAVTGSTGIAAINIGGQTLHSWAGVGLGNKPVRSLISRARYLSHVRERWMSVKVLIIDEVSMVSGRWFDVLEEIARQIRRIKKPFGGIQLVVCGDFFQLPPVVERPDEPGVFVFDSWTWDRCIRTQVKLTQVFRQKDPLLINMLNDMRIGQVSDESTKLLHQLARTVKYHDGIAPTEIVPLRWMADASNQRHLRRLPGDIFEFKATDTTGKDEYNTRVKLDPARAAVLFRQMVAPPVVKLKVGAQVMSLRNKRREEIVNGSVGRVIEFITPAAARTMPGVAVVSRFDVHDKKFEVHDKQEAEKRKSISGWKARQESAKELQRKMVYESTLWPLVLFENGVKAMLGPVEFTSETTTGVIQARRSQVPLILAWALTVHKSQGQTLNRVKVDLHQTFERGQAYVALSRCTSLDGLEVRNFSRDTVFAHPRVQRWSRDLISFSVNPSSMGVV